MRKLSIGICLFSLLCLISNCSRSNGMIEIESDSVLSDVRNIIGQYMEAYPDYRKLYLSNDFEFPYVDRESIEDETSSKLYILGRVSNHKFFDNNNCNGGYAPIRPRRPTVFFRLQGRTVFCFSSIDNIINVPIGDDFLGQTSDTIKDIRNNHENPLWVISVRPNGHACILTKDIWNFQKDRANPKHIQFIAPVVKNSH